jgi:peptidyl-prolyl cis-trans isomerase C
MNLSMNRLTAPLCVAATAATMLFSAAAQAAEPVLFEGNKTVITSSDVQADSMRMPPEMRPLVLVRPETVTQMASNLFARRALAQRAESEGLLKDPAVAAALRIARDKVLSDAMLEKIDQIHAPSDAVLESMARDAYKAKPERFQQPEQLKVRHILIAGKTQEAKAQAEKALADIKAGADFAKLAKEISADKGSAEKGGELGAFAKGRMVPEFEAAAFELVKPGALSDVVETQFGYHVLQLQERIPAGTKQFAEVRDELVKEARTKFTQDARVAEAESLLRDGKPNKEAIEAFSAGYKKTP